MWGHDGGIVTAARRTVKADGNKYPGQMVGLSHFYCVTKVHLSIMGHFGRSGVGRQIADHRIRRKIMKKSMSVVLVVFFLAAGLLSSPLFAEDVSIYDRNHGTYLGFVSDNGDVLDRHSVLVGWIKENGEVVNASGAYAGHILENGEVRDSSGFYVGSVSGDHRLAEGAGLLLLSKDN
jgi:hypothetical protein